MKKFSEYLNEVDDRYFPIEKGDYRKGSVLVNYSKITPETGVKNESLVIQDIPKGEEKKLAAKLGKGWRLVSVESEGRNKFDKITVDGLFTRKE